MVATDRLTDLAFYQKFSAPIGISDDRNRQQFGLVICQLAGHNLRYGF
jgi:hypothetical protein